MSQRSWIVSLLVVPLAVACGDSPGHLPASNDGGGGAGGSGPAGTGGEGGAGGTGGTQEERTCTPTWPGLQWGTSSDDEVLTLTAGPAGLLVGGYEHGVDGVTNIEPAGDALGFVLSLDAEGSPRWRYELDGPLVQTVEGLGVEPGGTTLFTGRTESQLGESYGGQLDAVFGRLDDKGQLQKLTEWGDEKPQHPVRIARQGDSIFVAGFNDVFVEGNAVEDWEHGFALGLDLDLQVRWTQTQPSPKPGRAMGLSVGDGGPFIMGWSQFRSGGVFVRRLDPEGKDPVWTASISPASLDSGVALARASDGDVLAAGTTIMALGGGSPQNSHGFLARLNPKTGALRWLKEYGSNAGDFVTDLATDGNDHFWVSGITQGSVVPGQDNAGGIDAFAIGFDGDGKQLQAFQVGTPGTDWGNAIAVDPCGRAFLGGSTEGSLLSPSGGGRDAFVAAAN